MRWLGCFVLALCSCGYTWRPALVLSVDAVHATRTIEDTGRSADRWDVRMEASFVLAPRPVRPLLRRERGLDGARFAHAPCLSQRLCAWERSELARTLAGVAPALSEAP